jgi:putative transcriptional regulator
MSEAFESIMRGLKEVKAHKKGKLKLKTHSIEIAPIPQFTSKKVKSIRNKLHLTQRAFASIFGVSPKTVEAWESGNNKPNGTAQRLLSLINRDNNFLKKEHILVES